MEKRIQPIEKRKELINRFKKQKALNDKNKKQIFENLNNFQLSIHPDAIEWYESTRGGSFTDE
ncbi:hypothetical protein [Halalkalibacter krulwichiae]|uniref:hypothetical protein n=1 Tax=Halalkalibacter krulwichiae TaxID=199441 RepID=UPI0008256D48|nr:hypothetical protein [Halalkalibacter krulwichiae]